jgi:putative drug exporter of the RND superfamily
MSTYLYRLGRFAVRRRWFVLGAWVLAVVALTIAGKALGGELKDQFNVPGVESQQATNLLKATFPAQAGGSAQVVFHTANGTVTDAANRAAIDATLAKMATVPHVVSASSPYSAKAQVSKDGTIAVSNVAFDESPLDMGKQPYKDLKASVTPATGAGVQVEFGGEVAQFGEQNSSPGSEGLGLLAAIVILIIAFGSVIAMGLSIGTALFGLATGISTVTLVSAFVTIPTVAETIAVMVGLGVGIDYALFIVTRHRAGLSRGLTVGDAAGRALATAGQAVLIAGTTVVIAICGLAVAGVPLVTWMGFGAAMVVAVTVAAALTLLPALMGFAGHNVDRFGIPGFKARVETGSRDEDGNYHGWARMSHHVSRHAVAYLLGSLALVLTLAIPMLSLRLGQPDTGNDPTSSTLRRSYDLLAQGFGPGTNGPLVLAVDLRGATGTAVLPAISRAVAAESDVASVAKPVVSPDGDTAVIQVTPRSSPQAAQTTSLIQHLRHDTLPEAVGSSGAHVYVGGPTAAFIDLSDRIASRLPLFIAAVIVLSFLLLLLVFRSLLIPLKAAVMNVLSIGAAYGVIVAIFQWGWGASLFGVHESLPISSFVPMLMFAILFGLSMDYEVFLLSRVREAYLQTGDNTESVATGIATTGRVITSAALIMISVFLSFVLGDNPTVKMIGIGLATAVFVDATIIRMVLVPATMKLLGDANWWLPRWLDRLLPNLDIEGESKLGPDELENPPEPPEEERIPVLVG